MGKPKATDTSPCGMTYGDIWESATSTHKHCVQCGRFKHMDEYSKAPYGVLNRVSMCKPCHSDYSKARNKRPDIQERRRELDRSPERFVSMRKSYVLRTYGEEGAAIEVRRLNGEPCDCCGGWTERMSIDHNHDTGKVRGLLCRDCNLILGYIQDDPKRLVMLMEYLEKHKEVI